MNSIGMDEGSGATVAQSNAKAEIEPEKTLGRRLQSARQKAGLTQQELCHKAGLSYSTLAKIERGAIKAPSVFTIRSLADVLQTSLDDLIGVLKPESDPALQQPANAPKRQAANGTRFVYFDINGCLVRFFQRAFSRIAEDSGISAEVIETTFWHYNDAACRGEMSIESFNATLGERFGLAEFDWQTYYLTAVDPIPEMQELLAWTAANYQVGLLSNIMPGLINGLMQAGKLPSVQYSAIVDSSTVRAIKPEEQIYQIAQAEAGCEPGEILLVDDGRSNLMTAERMGWHVLWFDDYRPAESIARIRNMLEPTLDTEQQPNVVIEQNNAETITAPAPAELTAEANAPSTPSPATLPREAHSIEIPRTIF